MPVDNTRKRNRLTLVCSYCKKRKVKCDKGKPCSACVRHHVGHLCSYTDNPWIDPLGESHDGEISGTVPAFIVRRDPSPYTTARSSARPPKQHSFPVKAKPETKTHKAPLSPKAGHPKHAPAVVAYGDGRSRASPNNPQSFNGSVPQLPLPAAQAPAAHSQYISSAPRHPPEIARLDSRHKTEIEALTTKMQLIEQSAAAPERLGTAPRAMFSSYNPASWFGPIPPSSHVTSNQPASIASAAALKPPILSAPPVPPPMQMPARTIGLLPAVLAVPAALPMRLSAGSLTAPPPLPPPRESPSLPASVLQPNQQHCIPPLAHDDTRLPQGDVGEWADVYAIGSAFGGKAGKLNDFGSRKKVCPWLAINPVESSEEFINFYEGYASIHIRDNSKRQNYGPFSWLTLMRKDKAMWSFWRALTYPARGSVQKQPTQILKQSGIYPQENGTPRCHEPRNAAVIKEAASSSTTSDRSGQDKSGVRNCTSGVDSETKFREKALDRDGYNDSRPYPDPKRPRSDHSASPKVESQQELRGSALNGNAASSPVKKSNGYSPDSTIRRLNANTISLGHTLFEGKIDQEMKLIEKIQMILPDRRVVWILINKFFVTVYPFIPLVDEADFKQEMVRILGPEPTSIDALPMSEEPLRVERRLDFANLGMMLIMLRFTYLSMFSNRSDINEEYLNTESLSQEAQQKKYLMSNPITIDIVGMAQLCLDQFLLLQQSYLQVLQCAFLMRLYHKYAPEEGDGADGGDLIISTGMLVQMGYLLGINREPDKFKDILMNDRVNNLTRKLWFYLMIMDIYQCFSYGNPLNVDENFYDTDPPALKEGNENIGDVELEKYVVLSFSHCQDFFSMIRSILNMCLSMNRGANLMDLAAKISEVETYTYNTYGCIEDYLTPFDPEVFVYPFIKAQRFKNLLHMKYFVLSLLMHIYMHYEACNNAELAYFYLRKLYAMLAGELMPHFNSLIRNMHEHFGEGSMLFMNPSIEETIHKGNQLNFMIIIRLNAAIYLMKSNPSHDTWMSNDVKYGTRFSKMCMLLSNLEKGAEISISAISQLKNRYYYAWRINKSHSFLLNKAYDESIYDELKSIDDMRTLDLTIEQIDELIDLADFPNKTNAECTSLLVDKGAMVVGQPQRDQRTNSLLDNLNLSTLDAVPRKQTSAPNVAENATIDSFWYQIALKKNNALGQQYPLLEGSGSRQQDVNRPRHSVVQATPHDTFAASRPQSYYRYTQVANDPQKRSHSRSAAGLDQEVYGSMLENGVDGANFDLSHLGPIPNSPFQFEDAFSYLKDIELYPFDTSEFQDNQL